MYSKLKSSRTLKYSCSEKRAKGANLGAEVEVAEQDGRLRAGDDEDDEDQEQEAVHVVDLRRPGIRQHDRN